MSIPAFGVGAVLYATSAESQGSSMSLVSLPWGCWDLLFLLHSCAGSARALPGQPQQGVRVPWWVGQMGDCRCWCRCLCHKPHGPHFAGLPALTLCLCTARLKLAVTGSGKARP